MFLLITIKVYDFRIENEENVDSRDVDEKLMFSFWL